MVQAKGRRRAYFIAFVVPALAFYALFFLVPFGQGLSISFTNWDGLSPKAPIRIEKAQFENEILSRLKRESDREWLKSLYSLEEDGQSYARLSLSGLKRSRLQRILAGIGYEAPGYRFIGLKNYRDILAGGVDERFYPRSYEKSYYNANSALPEEIEAKVFDSLISPSLDLRGRELFGGHYALEEGSYRLRPEKDEFALEDRIWLLKEVESGLIASQEVDRLIAAAKKSGLAQDEAGLAAGISAFSALPALSEASETAASEAARDLWGLGAFKTALARAWREEGFDLGVLGFTAFFAVGNVLIANLLAFGLALALDQKLRTGKALRSVFFLPNVLSMIVVALIWSFVFFHLLPRLTGIESWMGDPAKAPWLLVLVSSWQAAGYYMVVYLAGLQNLPTEVLEAAKIDGAGAWQRLKAIVLPLLLPAFTVSIFLSIANALKCFDLVYAMIGPTGYALGTVPYVMDIFFDAFANKMAGLATAKASLLFLFILGLTGLQLWIMKRREVEL